MRTFRSNEMHLMDKGAIIFRFAVFSCNKRFQIIKFVKEMNRFTKICPKS